MNLSVLFNKQNSGILQKLRPLENKILTESASKLKSWRKDGLNIKEVQKYYDWLDKIILAEYNNLFDL